MRILNSRISFFPAAIVFSLLMVLSVPSDAGLPQLGRWFEKGISKVEKKVFSKIKRGVSHASKIRILFEIGKEIKQKKRNERALNKKAAQERQIGKHRANAIKNNARERYNDKKISFTDMMSEFRRAIRVQKYHNERSRILGVLARREGRLHLEKKIIPVVISKTVNSRSLQKLLRRFDTAFKDFDGDIGKLIAKAAQLKMGIEGKQADVVSKAKVYFDKFAKVNNKIIKIRRIMKDLGIRDKKVERLLDKMQVAAFEGAQAARGVKEMSDVIGEDLKKVINASTKQLNIAKSELDKRHKEIKSIADKAAKMKPHSKPAVDRIGKIIANDPGYQVAKEKLVEAYLKKNEYLEHELAIGKRLNNLEKRWKKSSDAQERKNIEYQIFLLNKRLKEYKTENEKKKKAKTEKLTQEPETETKLEDTTTPEQRTSTDKTSQANELTMEDFVGHWEGPYQIPLLKVSGTVSLDITVIDEKTLRVTSRTTVPEHLVAVVAEIGLKLSDTAVFKVSGRTATHTSPYTSISGGTATHSSPDMEDEVKFRTTATLTLNNDKELTGSEVTKMRYYDSEEGHWVTSPPIKGSMHAKKVEIVE